MLVPWQHAIRQRADLQSLHKVPRLPQTHALGSPQLGHPPVCILPLRFRNLLPQRLRALRVLPLVDPFAHVRDGEVVMGGGLLLRAPLLPVPARIAIASSHLLVPPVLQIPVPEVVHHLLITDKDDLPRQLLLVVGSSHLSVVTVYLLPSVEVLPLGPCSGNHRIALVTKSLVPMGVYQQPLRFLVRVSNRLPFHSTFLRDLDHADHPPPPHRVLLVQRPLPIR
mmetsp:Transcript_38494/g.96420  ORF Transcript_38494/g.96420 Transcript_38494/m.96420 type:complete len:224 (-) Transcript_38494:265-936(-)